MQLPSFRHLLRMCVFALGLALCCLMIAAMVWPIMKGDSDPFGPSEARTVFWFAFTVSGFVLASHAIWRKKR